MVSASSVHLAAKGYHPGLLARPLHQTSSNRVSMVWLFCPRGFAYPEYIDIIALRTYGAR